MSQYEAKCTNKECPANQVWVLDVDEDGKCDTCGEALSDYVEAPTQKQADPDAVPEKEPVA